MRLFLLQGTDLGPSLICMADNVDLNSGWSSAADYFSKGDYTSALKAYLAAPATGNPDYYFNLGATTFKLEDYGSAFAYFSKAKDLGSSSPALKAALSKTHEKLIAKIGDGELDPASNPLETLNDSVGIAQVGFIFGFLALFLTLVVIKRNRVKSGLGVICALFAIAAMSMGTLEISGQSLGILRPKVMTVAQISAKSGPSESFPILRDIPSGVTLRLVTSEQTKDILWHQVAYSSDLVGWVKDADLLLLDGKGGTSEK